MAFGKKKADAAVAEGTVAEATALEQKEKLGANQKIGALAASIVAATATGYVPNYINLYYTELMGVAIGTIGAIIMITKLLDGVSDIIMGMHVHTDITPKFWGEFIQSLYNGLNRQIIMARLRQPLNTLRRIQVAVPSRAQFEPGFYRWLERLARLAGNLDCRIVFHGRSDTLAFVNEYMRNRHPGVRAEFHSMPHWNELPRLASSIAEDHLFVVVTARKGTVSYKTAMDRLPDELTRFFSGTNMMIIFPDQFGDAMDEMTFAQPQHTEEDSIYGTIRKWIRKVLKI